MFFDTRGNKQKSGVHQIKRSWLRIAWRVRQSVRAEISMHLFLQQRVFSYLSQVPPRLLLKYKAEFLGQIRSYFSSEPTEFFFDEKGREPWINLHNQLSEDQKKIFTKQIGLLGEDIDQANALLMEATDKITDTDRKMGDALANGDIVSQQIQTKSPVERGSPPKPKFPWAFSLIWALIIFLLGSESFQLSLIYMDLIGVSPVSISDWGLNPAAVISAFGFGLATVLTLFVLWEAAFHFLVDANIQDDKSVKIKNIGSAVSLTALICILAVSIGFMRNSVAGEAQLFTASFQGNILSQPSFNNPWIFGFLAAVVPLGLSLLRKHSHTLVSDRKLIGDAIRVWEQAQAKKVNERGIFEQVLSHLEIRRTALEKKREDSISHLFGISQALSDLEKSAAEVENEQRALAHTSAINIVKNLQLDFMDYCAEARRQGKQYLIAQNQLQNNSSPIYGEG